MNIIQKQISYHNQAENILKMINDNTHAINEAKKSNHDLLAEKLQNRRIELITSYSEKLRNIFEQLTINL